MALTWSAGLYDSEGSFNRLVKDHLSAQGWPSAFPAGVSAYYDWPTQNLTFPAVTVTHMGGQMVPVGGGDLIAGGAGISGVRQQRQADISCWVDAQANPNWSRDLRQLRDTVELMLLTNRRGGQLYMVYSGTGTPPTAGTFRIESWAEQHIPQDASNPAVRRYRFVVRLGYVERWP
mgnify:CR=1 FL=1